MNTQRIEEIQKQTAYPDSISVQQALLQVWNECSNGLQPIETAPKDGTYIILFGDSGYITTPLRCQVCRYDAEYRPLQPWVTHSNDSFEDGGDPATHWMSLPQVTFKGDTHA